MKLLSPHLWLILLALHVGWLESCRSRQNKPSAPVFAVPTLNIEPDLKPLLDSYIQDARENSIPVTTAAKRQLKQLVWTDDIPGATGRGSIVLGRCRRLNENLPDLSLRVLIVEIKRPDGRLMAGPVKLDDATLKAVVYHELGHCLHDYHGHLPDTQESIMSTTIPKTRYSRMGDLVREHFHLMKTKLPDQ